MGMRLSTRIRRTVATAWLVVPAIAATAHAQTDGLQARAAAQTLYDQAVQEMAAKNYDSACPKLEQVTGLIPYGLDAKMALAQCYEGRGRLASACAQYAFVETLATRAGDEQRARDAADKQAALRPKLATLTVELHDALRRLPGLVVTRDGLSLGAAQWGVLVPVDAGPHEIVVTAPGYKPWKKHFDVAQDGENVTVQVEPLQPAPKPVTKVPPVPKDAPAPERPWQRPLSFAAMGLGAAGLAVGAVLGGVVLAKKSESNDGHCNKDDFCDTVGLDLRRQAVALGNASTVALILGGTLASQGIVLFFTAPPSSSHKGPGKRVSAMHAAPLLQITPRAIRFRTSW